MRQNLNNFQNLQAHSLRKQGGGTHQPCTLPQISSVLFVETNLVLLYGGLTDSHQLHQTVSALGFLAGNYLTFRKGNDPHVLAYIYPSRTLCTGIMISPSLASGNIESWGGLCLTAINQSLGFLGERSKLASFATHPWAHKFSEYKESGGLFRNMVFAGQPARWVLLSGALANNDKFLATALTLGIVADALINIHTAIRPKQRTALSAAPPVLKQ